MRILGLMMARNCESVIGDRLDRMASYCDSVCVLDDRSDDRTAEIARSHPLVLNLLRARPEAGEGPWFFPESLMLQILSHMADLERPDWSVRLDSDEWIEPGSAVRGVLESMDSNISGVKFPRLVTWNDPEYPDMFSLMRTEIDTTLTGGFWRYCPGLTAERPLHNPRIPVGVGNFGRIVECTSLV